MIQGYLNRHHIGKRIVNGRRSNYPLFAFQVTASLKMSDNGKYALPVLDRGPVLDREEIAAHAETARVWRETMLDDFRRAADAGEESEVDAAAGTTEIIDSNEFADDDGAGAGSASAAGDSNRF